MKKLISLIILLSVNSYANQMIIYPNNGQSMKKQNRDKVACQNWATQNTGVDPMSLAMNSTNNSYHTEQVNKPNEFVGNTLGGAALGSIVGIIAKDSSKGAGAGALWGAGIGAVSSLGARNQRKQTNRQNQQQHNQNMQSQMRLFNRAFVACMSGRGYTIN